MFHQRLVNQQANLVMFHRDGRLHQLRHHLQAAEGLQDQGLLVMAREILAQAMAAGTIIPAATEVLW